MNPVTKYYYFPGPKCHMRHVGTIVMWCPRVLRYNCLNTAHVITRESPRHNNTCCLYVVATNSSLESFSFAIPVKMEAQTAVLLDYLIHCQYDRVPHFLIVLLLLRAT